MGYAVGEQGLTMITRCLVQQDCDDRMDPMSLQASNPPYSLLYPAGSKAHESGCLFMHAASVSGAG